MNRKKIEVSGNIDIIGNMTYLATENISLADMSAPTKKTVNLVIPDGVTASVQTAVVTVEITKKDNSAVKTEHEANKT